MANVWTFLTTGTNAEAIGVLIAALVAIGGFAAWLFARSRAARATVSATRGGVAIGGNVTGATITTRHGADTSPEL